MFRNLISITALALAVFFLLAPLSAEAAQVLTNDGKTFSGTILEETADYIVMRLDEGKVEVRIGRDQIAHIQYVEDKEDFRREYALFGASLSAPAGLNFIAGYSWKDFGFKFTGCYWDARSSGFQTNLSLKLTESKDLCASLSLVGGTSHLIPGHSGWVYGGLGGELNFHGFLIEADLVTPYDSNVFFIPIQIGYVLRLD